MPFIATAFAAAGSAIGLSAAATSVIGSAIAVGGTAAAIKGTADVFEKQRKEKSKAAAALKQSILNAEATARGDPGFRPEIVQPTPPPESGQVSMQLGTGQERARRRRSRSGSGREGRAFGGAGLLVPEADVRRRTLG